MLVQGIYLNNEVRVLTRKIAKLLLDVLCLRIFYSRYLDPKVVVPRKAR